MPSWAKLSEPVWRTSSIETATINAYGCILLPLQQPFPATSSLGPWSPCSAVPATMSSFCFPHGQPHGRLLHSSLYPKVVLQYLATEVLWWHSLIPYASKSSLVTSASISFPFCGPSTCTLGADPPVVLATSFLLPLNMLFCTLALSIGDPILCKHSLIPSPARRPSPPSLIGPAISNTRQKPRYAIE